MSFRAIAAVAGLGLLAGACNQPAPPAPAEPTPVADQPATPAAPDAFAYAVNYECEGGGAVDVVFNSGNGSDVLARLDGGAAETLPGNPDSQTGMEYKNATTTLQTDGSSVTWKSGATTKTCMIKTRELPAPTVAGVVRTLTATDAGASVDVKVGDKISVALVGVPTAGYVWGAASPPAFIKATDGPGGATSTAQFTPGFAGGSHWEVVVIEAIAAGEGEITLAQRRPWETTAEPDANTFKFKLKAS
ncbi:MAG TPA: protease inhibitor I42 family protein [Hyphomonadaceae bacterium]|nr:protease inhibitor I42 family protein [Hyphomonadaceae bacterium]HPI49643.1 protease inhibitor I42 family protein [Hyphomonadaceae bacterium]